MLGHTTVERKGHRPSGWPVNNNTSYILRNNHGCRGSGKVSYHTFASLAAQRQLQSSLFVVSVGTLPVQHHGMAEVYPCSVATSLGKRKLACG
jgi:hypothetical protein